MESKSTHIRIDRDLKEQAQQLFFKLGMDMTTAINIFLRQAVKEQAIPFRIGEPSPNIETLEAIAEVQRLKKDPNKKSYASFAELLEDIDHA